MPAANIPLHRCIDLWALAYAVVIGIKGIGSTLDEPEMRWS
jgi:hypothetical protein